MENKQMDKKFGLLTAICMVVGTVIGSGVFIKGGKVLAKTGGNLLQGLLVIAICGVICIICSLVFAELSSKYEKVNGLVDYAEAALGSKYAYYMGWFLTTIYTPALASMLAFFSGMMFCELFGITSIDLSRGLFTGEMVAVGGAFLLIGYAINAISPKLAGRLQISMTVIKLIPLLVMGIVGTIVGLSNGNTMEVLNYVNTADYAPVPGGFFTAIVAFAFSFEGWVLATSINSELKDAKRNLPIALIVGALITVVIYIIYIFSMSSIGSVETILGTWPIGQTLPRIAFDNLLGSPFGTIAMAFVMVSCLGTMNGLIMASARSQYSVASRGLGPMPKFYGDVDSQSNFCIKSALFGMIFAGYWYAWTVVMYWNGPDFMANVHNNMFFGFEADEVCIINLYLMYIPMFISIMVKCKEFGFIKRFVLPILACCCSFFMCYCCWKGWGTKACLGYLTFFAVDLIIGRLVMSPKKEFDLTKL